MSSGPLSLAVNSGPSVTTTTLSGATAGQTDYSQTLMSSGGVGAITWSMTSGSLPASLFLDPSSGVISGTVDGSASSQTFTVIATDGNGVSSSKPRSLSSSTPRPPSRPRASPRRREASRTIRRRLASAAGTLADHLEHLFRVAPTGLSLTSSNGLISGTVAVSATTQTFT